MIIIKAAENIRDLIIPFFNSINDKNFTPHPFDGNQMDKIIKEDKDLYYFIIFENKIIAYGMLRGWAEGYDIPSLGIYIDKEYRGLGIGNMLMNFLHISAKLRGSEKIRLTVIKTNTSAISLYRKLGYIFIEDTENSNKLTGFCRL
jgi:ribosomal protein S18 acetylase RimI-like enzyme